MLSTGGRRRLGAALLVTLWLAACTGAVQFADIKSADMMMMPGSTKSIPMPPKRMRDKVEQLMARGEAPSVILLSEAQLKRRCKSDSYLLGCMTDTSCKMGLVYVRSGLSPELEHMARVHEIAHCSFGWRHR